MDKQLQKEKENLLRQKGVHFSTRNKLIKDIELEVKTLEDELRFLITNFSDRVKKMRDA